MRVTTIVPVCSYPDPTDENGGPHPYLLSALDSILMCGVPDIEVLIGIDGHRPNVIKTLNAWRNGRRNLAVTIKDFPFAGRWGNAQRNALLTVAQGQMISWMDQDDQYAQNALGKVLATHGCDRPIICRCSCYQQSNRTPRLWNPVVIWREQRVEQGNVGGHMFLCPNRQELLGRWEPEDKYEADYAFISSTLARFATVGIGPIWDDTILAYLRPWAKLERP